MSTRLALIDDDPTIRDLLCALFVEEGYLPVPCFVDDADYATLRALAPAVIILDVHLRGPITGQEILATLQTDPALARIPVIVASADQRALECLATQAPHQRLRLLRKPFDLDDLLTLVQDLTEPSDPPHKERT